MPSYIYKIVSPHTDKVYIGSTAQPIKKRFACHKTFFRNGSDACSSYEIFEAGDARFELLETIADGKNKKEIEQKYIEHCDNTVNYHYAGRKTRKGRRVYKRKTQRVSNNPYYRERSKLKVKCLCGNMVSLHNRKQHYRTAKHSKSIRSLFLSVNNQT